MSGWREAFYAAVLAAVLGAGVIGVLLLNTSMQQQSERIDRQNARITNLGERVQQLRTTAERQSSPALLARRAQRLELRPIDRVHYIPARSGVSGRAPAASRGHAG